MDCLECREKMLPDNPAQPFYMGFNSKLRSISPVSGCLLPLCYSCPNFDYEKEVLKHSESTDKVVIIENPQPKDIAVLKAQVRYLLKKVNAKESVSKKAYTVK